MTRTRAHALAMAGILAIAAPARADRVCESWSGVERILRPGHVLLIGEIHGTVESPAFVGDLACHAGTADLPLTVGLEIPHSEQERLDAFLSSDGGAAAERALLAGPFWTRDYQDGRSSRAMVDLLHELRRLRAGGADLEVVAFDVDGSVPDRDAAMGRRLARAAEEEGRLVVALTGNYHNRLTVGAPWDDDWRPMGLFVQDGLPGRTLVSLDVAHGGGEAWICTGSSAADCGSQRLSGQSERRGAIELFESIRDGHSGLYHVGTLTVSAPAVDDRSPGSV